MALPVSIARNFADDPRHATLLRRAVDASGEVVFITDTDGVFIYVNQQFTVVYGYSADEVIGRATPRVLKSHRQPANFYRTFWNTLTRGESLRSTHVNRTKSGQLIVIDATSSAVVEDGAIVGFLSIQRDVTAQREAERAAQLAHVAIEHAPDAVCWFEPSGRILYVNQMTMRLSGHTFEELSQRTFYDLFSEGSRAWFEARWQEMVRVGELDLKAELIRHDRSRLSTDVRIARVLFGQDSYGCALLRDASERQRLEAQLLQAQKMEALGRLTGGIAHDFNNLLTAMSGYADLALARITDHGVAADVREIQAAATRASGLTRHLLTFSRRQASQPELVDLNAAVERSLRLLGRLVGEDVAVRLSAGDTVWPVRIDPGQLDQALMNLAVNARDAMPKGGTLTFTTGSVDVSADHPLAASAGQTGVYSCVSVADSGTGIPAELRLRILEPFFTTKPAGKGTGLGLSTVITIVKQGGGFLTVDSEVGHGTTVTVYLPRSVAKPDAVNAAATSLRQGGGDRTVLLVEDETSVRTVAARFLTERGYRVLVAKDVRDALRIARTHPRTIDLLLTDIVMPMLSGPDLAQRLVEWRPAMRVLYVSGYTEALGLPAGHDRFTVVRKPFTAETLFLGVTRALDAS